MAVEKRGWAMNEHPQVRWFVLPEVPDRADIILAQQKLLALIDHVAYGLCMSNGNRTITALKGQFDRDYRAFKESLRKQQQLRPAYDSYREELARSEIISDRIRRLMVMLWIHEPVNLKRTVTEKAHEIGIALPEGWETVTTWEAVMEVVRQFPNIQVVDLLQALKSDLRLGVSRQNLDSALMAHPEIFETKKSGRGKFISLREDADAAATKRMRRKH